MQTRLVALVLGALAVGAPVARGAPCVTACKDEIRSCANETCQGLKPAARVRCKRRECRKPIVQACLGDLSVCGATRARPKPPTVSPPPMPYPY
jgi:hypothetical protein